MESEAGLSLITLEIVNLTISRYGNAKNAIFAFNITGMIKVRECLKNGRLLT